MINGEPGKNLTCPQITDSVRNQISALEERYFSLLNPGKGDLNPSCQKYTHPAGRTPEMRLAVVQAGSNKSNSASSGERLYHNNVIFLG